MCRGLLELGESFRNEFVIPVTLESVIELLHSFGENLPIILEQLQAGAFRQRSPFLLLLLALRGVRVSEQEQAAVSGIDEDFHALVDLLHLAHLIGLFFSEV